MVSEGKVVRSCTDYILGTDHCLFCNISVQETRNNTDQYMVIGYLRSAPKREHTKYRKRRKRLPLRPLSNPTR